MEYSIIIIIRIKFERHVLDSTNNPRHHILDNHYVYLTIHDGYLLLIHTTISYKPYIHIYLGIHAIIFHVNKTLYVATTVGTSTYT